MTMRKKTILKKLAATLNNLAGDFYSEAKVLDKEDGFSEPTLCWDGPYDWINCTQEQSYLCGEAGDYSMPCEPEILEVLKLTKANGYYFEAATCTQLCLVD